VRGPVNGAGEAGHYPASEVESRIVAENLFWGGEPPKSGGEFFRRLWDVGREAAAKKNAVVQAVSGLRQGKTRDQLRGLFEEEMDRRAVPRDPIWVEQKLDELEWSSADRARETVHRLGIAAATVGRIAQARGFPDAPEWMQPPEDASHWAWTPDPEQMPVDIDPQATVWLDRALASAPRRIGNLTALFDVWFDRQLAGEGHLVTVNLGAHRIGTLNRDASQRFMSVMEAAADRHMKPRTNAQLARAAHLIPPYLLVVDVPAPDAPQE
jgi:hypothetical protein